MQLFCGRALSSSWSWSRRRSSSSSSSSSIVVDRHLFHLFSRRMTVKIKLWCVSVAFFQINSIAVPDLILADRDGGGDDRLLERSSDDDHKHVTCLYIDMIIENMLVFLLLFLVILLSRMASIVVVVDVFVSSKATTATYHHSWYERGSDIRSSIRYFNSMLAVLFAFYWMLVLNEIETRRVLRSCVCVCLRNPRSAQQSRSAVRAKPSDRASNSGGSKNETDSSKVERSIEDLK